MIRIAEVEAELEQATRRLRIMKGEEQREDDGSDGGEERGS